MSSDERSSPENGIWLCHLCSTIIDKDEKKYTVKKLKKWKEAAEQAPDVNKTERKQPVIYAIIGLLLATLIAVIIWGVITNNNVESLDENLDDFIALQENPLITKEINPEKAALSYKTGLQLFKETLFGSAAKEFEKAITEQEKITGVDSFEVGIVYLMLGLSRHYSGNSIRDDGGDAVSAITCAIQIFEQQKDYLDLAYAYNIQGIVFFDKGEEYSIRAKEQAINSVNALMRYAPEAINVVETYIDSIGTSSSCFSEPYDYDSLYRACSSLLILQDNYELLGLISWQGNDFSEAFYYLNLALVTDSCLASADSALATYEHSSDEELNEAISFYLSFKQEYIDARKKQVKIYMVNSKEDDVDCGSFVIGDIYFSVGTASILTSRAKTELDLGFPEIALSDYLDAEIIWKTFPEGERYNISSTYRGLALTILKIAETANDSKSGLNERKKEIMEYTDLAIYYDKQLYGESFPRTASSLQVKGFICLAYNDNEDAIQCYQEAKNIYEAWGMDKYAQECQNRITQIVSDNNKYQ